MYTNLNVYLTYLISFKMFEHSSSSSKSSFTVAGRYRLVRKIGSGSFGDIYLGVDKQVEGEVSNHLFIYLQLHNNYS